MFKYIKKWFKRKKIEKNLNKRLNEISNQELSELKDVLNWLTTGQPSVYFRLNKEEIHFFKNNFIEPWQMVEYDDSFLNWDPSTPYSELNYLIKCFHGEYGFMKSQDAFDYLCKIHPDLLFFHQNLAKRSILNDEQDV